MHFASVSLILGIACFMNLVGLEKPILAVGGTRSGFYFAFTNSRSNLLA